MTIKELIKELTKYPDNLKVEVFGDYVGYEILRLVGGSDIQILESTGCIRIIGKD